MHEDRIQQRVDTYSYSSFSAATTFKNVSMFTLPSNKCEILGQFILVTQAFAGTGLTTIDIMTGTSSGSYKEYLAAQSVLTSGVKTLKGTEPALRYMIPLSGGPVYVRMEGNVALSNLTQGSLTVYTSYVQHDY